MLYLSGNIEQISQKNLKNTYKTNPVNCIHVNRYME